MNVFWQAHKISKSDREKLHNHKSIVIWLTGLSGSGKSTIANALEQALYKNNYNTFILDGDNIRHGLCNDLTFTEVDRNENIRRISELAKLFLNAGVITITAFISPFKIDREKAKNIIGKDNFVEIYCKCSLNVCEQRDVKGLYKQARKGIIRNFTGITSPYEEPTNPDLILDTAKLNVDDCVQEILSYLKTKQII